MATRRLGYDMAFLALETKHHQTETTHYGTNNRNIHTHALKLNSCRMVGRA